MTLFFLLSCVFGWVVGNALLALLGSRMPQGAPPWGMSPWSNPSPRRVSEAVSVSTAHLCVGCDHIIATQHACPLCGSVALLNLGKFFAGVAEPTLGEVDDVLHELED